MKISTRSTRTPENETRPLSRIEEPASTRSFATERPRVVMDCNPLMARVMLAQKMAEKHMYAPAYDEKDRERGF